jgi:outer membrane cobalamin receptor
MPSIRLTVHSAVAAALIVTGWPRTSAAQDPIQETVVVTATASPVRLSEIGRQLLVITREQIEALPVQSVPELLSYLASVDVRTRGTSGVQADVSIRGASFGQTLVLVDGVRMNDAQSAHHNMDLPVLLEDVERIELLAGPSASVHGADGFGGAINVVTRREPPVHDAAVSAGSFGYVDGRVRFDTPVGGYTQSLWSSASRSDGFMYDRDFRTAGVGGRARLGQRTSVAAGYVDKAFGANGFYGPAPSKEWTGQTLVSAEHTTAPAAGWATAVRASYRTHSDRFLYDIRTPQLFENRHRTHAALVSGGTDRELGSGRLHLGADGGGDWIRSTNLGDHDVAHGSAVAEYQYRPGARTTIVSGLRFDGYSRYGSSWNPSVNASVWTTSSIKLRASAGHTFRVPTFTELYYHDPANQARDDLQPERGWSWDAGADWLPAAAWMASATAFVRHDQDIIDWVRDSTAERWHTANVRRLDTAGIELGVRRMVGKGGSLDAQYAWLHSDADPVAQLSKYVLDYAPQRFVVSAAIPIRERMTVGGRLGYTRRADGRDYTLADVRLARAFGRVRLFVEGYNLLDAEYQEVLGVDMPGRSARAGLELLRF